MFRRFVALVLFVSVFFTAPIFTRGAAAEEVLPAIDPVATSVVDLVNGHRAAAGLAPVTINAVLMTEATRFSAVQASLSRLDHRGDDGSTAGQRLRRAGYDWTFYGENLAAGQVDAASVVAAWMASPGHQAIILDPRAEEIGIGHTVRADDPAGYINYWALEVARPRR